MRGARIVINGAKQAGVQAALLTCAAMIAFAANSLLCRLALRPDLIDPASFTTIRVVSGAVTLSAIVLLRSRPRSDDGAGWPSALMLFAYMVFFSFAYVSLSAGTGALVLFGAVQITMFVFALRGGERFTAWSWVGLAIAILGLVYLVSPGLSAPNPIGAAFMTLAGIAWGLYSLSGRGAADPLDATRKNFLYSVPLVLIVSFVFLRNLHVSPAGAALAVASGAIASGCGYVIWYAALAHLTAGRAAIIQLSVPVIAAFGGVLLLSESVTWRLILASAATLGGVGIVLAQRIANISRR